jgi:hypothetical protein
MKGRLWGSEREAMVDLTHFLVVFAKGFAE